MVQRRTVDLLPEIFRTETNKKFLAATLDQLIQEPNIKRTQGFVGRRIGPGVDPSDSYVIEPTKIRRDYQLEPGVVFLQPDTPKVTDAITYPGIIDGLSLAGAATQRQDRLFESQYYSWDPFCDLDKFTNYSQYYWLPDGPESVDVSPTLVPFTDDFFVTRTDEGYRVTGYSEVNPTITLARGGSYRFYINQPGNDFWLQAAPGSSGVVPTTPNISSRDVLGTVDNGQDVGVITFNVPFQTDQDFFYAMPDIGPVDLVTNLRYDSLNGVYVEDFLAANPTGIDGVTDLNGRTVIFLPSGPGTNEFGWNVVSPFDPVARNNTLNGQPGSFDTTAFDQSVPITDPAVRYSIWQIQYVQDNDGRSLMQVNSILSVVNLTKFTIRFGTQYSSTQWYKNAFGQWEQIPLLTAILDTLYYQDANSDTLFGVIKLANTVQGEPIDIEDIVGAKNYTANNGVTLTNGLKITFRGLVEPAIYTDKTFYVEGVGTGPGLDARVGFVDGEAYFGPFHVVNGQKITGLPGDDTIKQFIYDFIEDSLVNEGAGTPANAPLPTQSQLGAVEGNGIRLIPVEELITPEAYVQRQDGNQDLADPKPKTPDYITINRASRDRNAWSRSNRWFHVDVLRSSAQYNNQAFVVDNDLRARRPIIEFRANLDLFGSGTQGKVPVNVIDFSETDAFSDVAGKTSYSYDDYEFVQGSLVIFAADIDANVRNKIFRVDFIDPDGLIGSLPVIKLSEITDGTVLRDQMVVCVSGETQRGLSFWYDGAVWKSAQLKDRVNQPPLFDVRDSRGFSFGDPDVYPSTTFQGSRLFGYASTESLLVDTVLGFALQYLNIDNVGDIVFENYLYTDTFNYVDLTTGVVGQVSDGFVRQYIDRVTFSNLIGWLPAAAENRSRQVFQFSYQGEPLVLDVPVIERYPLAPLQLFVGGIFVEPRQYTVQRTDISTTISFIEEPPLDTVIEVLAISDVASPTGFYEVPVNLENNALNQQAGRLTLGTIRSHYQTIGQNLENITGPIVGPNNTRDLGNILPLGQNIIQQSAPLTLGGTFIRNIEFQIFDSLRFNSQEYEKFKARMMNLVAQGDFVNSQPPQILDTVIEEIGLGRTEQSPFYWSDMLPANETFVEYNYPVTFISTDVFDLTKVYDFSSSNYQSVLVYLNGDILTSGYDYDISTDSATVVINVPLAVGDTVTVREYSTTYGNFVPNTPTKMGLYPSFRPLLFVNEAGIPVIRGHDGSITRAYGDVRDDVLLEFETRIFNNLKIKTAVPIVQEEVIPGQFRQTDYTISEINTMLSTDFLSWVGWNRLDYTTQNFNQADPFTYNYSQTGDKLSRQPLPGAWRGIYQYFYDTTAPNTRPWEMLGFSEEPEWWQNQYGPAPYTSGNLVLWEDLANGIIADPNNPRVAELYRRPGLLDVIPSGSEGQLLPPLDSVVGGFDSTTFRKSWVFGDDGPTENAWRTSSAYPFSIMRLLALTKPAKFFSLFADRDRYQFDTEILQYVWDGRYRLDAKNLAPLYGSGVSKASFINWIIDYNRQRGIDSTVNLTNALSSIDIRLCWRLAGFSDKKLLKIYVERSTPGGSNSNFLLPDESYQVLLYKNQPFLGLGYSAVIVQYTGNGYSVSGYDVTRPYFNIYASRTRGLSQTFTVAGTTVTVSTEHTDRVVQVPYGFVFTNLSAVCDFLLSYGAYLESQGAEFTGRENGFIINWQQMCQEFLYWSQQGWAAGSMINLNPAATKLSLTRPGSVVDTIQPPTIKSVVLNQNRQPILPADLVIDRIDNNFSISSVNSNTVSYAGLELTSFEHLVVLDNTSLFADLLYEPVTGARQSRVLISGWISGDWNGTVNAPGFVINEDNIKTWQPNQIYTKGEIVLFKDEYWSATGIIQPSEEFNYNQWLRSDYAEVKKGLLPNAANSSNELATAYNTRTANLESEIDLFSYGLIGFRPRQYMQALNLDDVSQVNLYQQFLGTKGTVRAAEIFSLADLGKETAEYQIYEYWSMLRSTYGANANRSYIELLLDQSRLESDPGLIQIINPDQTSEADQTVLVSQVWKTSVPLSGPNVLPTTLEKNLDRSLPTAGYVNLSDVDFTVFSLDAENVLGAFDDLTGLGVGSTVWVAKTNAYDWGIFTVQSVPGDIIQVSDNLDGRCLVQFNQNHGLIVGDYLVIKFFDIQVNGIYQVRALPTLNSVLIDLTLTGFQTTINSQGIGLTFKTARVSQAADVVNLDYARDLGPGAKVWVNNNGQGLWQVIEKTDPFTLGRDLVPDEPVNDSGYGTAVAQGFNNLATMVGSPGFGTDLSTLEPPPGAVYLFVKSSAGTYISGSKFQCNAMDIKGLGNAIDLGDMNWAIIGASGSRNDQGYALVTYVPTASNAVEQVQLLIAPDLDWNQAEFGYSVAMSVDERWLYVGAPGVNKVYAYGLVPVQSQSVTYEADGSTDAFDFATDLVVDSAEPGQIEVKVNGGLLYSQSPNPDYTVSGDNVVLSKTPAAGSIIDISRRVDLQLDQRIYYDVSPTSVSPSGGTGAEFSVSVVRGIRNPTISQSGENYAYGSTIVISGSVIGGGPDLQFDVARTGAVYTSLIDIVASQDFIQLRDVTGLQTGQDVIKIGGTGTLASGTTILAIDDDANIVYLSAPITGTGSITFVASPGPITAIDNVSGTVGITNNNNFDLQNFLYTADDITAFRVIVDGVFFRPYLDYTFAAGILTFVNNPPAGAEILITANSHWQYADVLTVSGLASTARFGHSVSTTSDGRQVIVGAPDITIDAATQAGKFFVFDRSWQKFVIDDDSADTYYTDPSSGSMVQPVSVRLNGEFLSNADTNVGGQFTLDFGTNAITLQDIQLQVGDSLEIDTNNFSLIDVKQSQTVNKEAQFGWAVDQCVNDCSLYVSAPFDSSIAQRAGIVEFFQNQSRIYGTTTNTTANPVLTPGDHLRVNGIYVELSDPPTWSGSSSWSTGTFVKNGAALYQALRDVPSGVAINQTSYWTPVGWVNVLAKDIVDQVSNTATSVSGNLTLTGDGSARTFDIGNIYSAAMIVNPVVYLDNVLQQLSVDYTYSSANKQITFSAAPSSGSRILVLSGLITISAKNQQSAQALNKITVMPGTGSMFDTLAFETYVYQQTISSPLQQQQAEFGYSIFISDNTTTLVVGAPGGSMIRPTTFDNDTTTFDANSTTYSETVPQSGAVYTFDQLPAANASVTNPAQFVFGQQVTKNTILPFDRFGSALDLTTGVLLVGAPANDLGDSQVDYGTVIQAINADRSPAWRVLRQQTAVVDIDLLNSVFIYDRFAQGDKQYLDYFDPLQGKLLGAVRQNLDYIGAIDPASYNIGALNNSGNRWAQEKVGQIWWDTSNARFIDPNQDDIVYASRRWGQLFPGSTIDMYQWISSTVPPSEYAGPGSVRSVSSYVISSGVDEQGFLITTYYFWVSGLLTVARSAKKTLSVATLARYIENPRGSGIPYLAPINASCFALYNSLPYIASLDTVLHVEYDQQLTDDAVHVEYQLIAQDRADGILTGSLYRKFIDSFAGIDSQGSPVPDPNLPPSERYGVQFRPRQSFFVDRFLALQNYLTETNKILLQIPVAENRIFNLLNSSEPEPSATSGQWDKRVQNLEELSFQDIYAVDLGYRYLVVSDSDNNGLWTIYQVALGTTPGSRVLDLYRVQTYDTKLYWNYIDWYAPGYNTAARIERTVPNVASLDTLNLPVGSSVKVLSNPQGKFEIYQLTDSGWIRVALEDGTIEFSSVLWNYAEGRFGFDSEVFDATYFDAEPVIETRKIIEAINQEIMVGELELERNRLLILMFNFILSEQQAPEWLTKTSLIDVDHIIRELRPFQIYRQDNQDFVLNYIQEVKPYHTQIREFNLRYQGADQYLGSVTDFDLPAYYDTAQNLFVSPILDNTGQLSTTSSVPSTSEVWQTFPWNQWYQNYKLEIASVSVLSGGSGYTVPPQVIVTGECDRPAVMRAFISVQGQVSSIQVLDPGAGYTTTALIEFNGGNGTGAKAIAVMTNDLVRTMTTRIKYDRYQYSSDITDWQPNVSYDNGTIVRYDDRAWEANSDDSTAVNTPIFDPTDWILVPAGDLNGLDRTRAYYAPDINQPGIDLAQLISGLEYPGVQVYGRDFDMTTAVDALYASNFTDPYLGVLPTSINVDGGAFVDTYESHAPEELVPGIGFDTLDFRVYTTPGSDWQGAGHGFSVQTRAYEFTGISTEFDFSEELEFPVQVSLFVQNSGIQLIPDINYTVDWPNKTVNIISGVLAGQILIITAYGLGGGNQIYRNSYIGNDIGSSVIVPINRDLIYQAVAFVNGSQVPIRFINQLSATTTEIVFFQSWTINDYVLLTLFGENTNSVEYSWSTPQTQYIVSDGSSQYTLTNSLQGTNPINVIVNVNGSRVRPAESRSHIALGSQNQFLLPDAQGYLQSSVVQSEVSVYVDDVAQTAGIDFVLDPDDGSSDRTVTLTEAPAFGSTVIVSVNTASPYYISGTTLYWRPAIFLPGIGTTISVTTWNDTRQQDLLTLVYQGPETTGVTVTEGYDDTLFDTGSTSGDPGSYDYSAGSLILINRFDTGRLITNTNRVIVSLNGRYLFPEQGFTVDGTFVLIPGDPISSSAIVAITVMTMDDIPGEIAFRIFQDMRGSQQLYRITTDTSSTLSQDLSASADIIYVQDASLLPVPDLQDGLFGLVTIDGERIAYRSIDTINNTISGLRRGTAGTAAAPHLAGAAIYDITIGNLLPAEYQNRFDSQIFHGDGVTKSFTSTITLQGVDSSEQSEALLVSVGGTRLEPGFATYILDAVDPVTVMFTNAPPAGVEIKLEVYRGQLFYQRGVSTPSDGIPLQETSTLGARFIRGE